jgi:tricorn protease
MSRVTATAVTNFQKHPVRFLSIADNGTLCFSFDGDIYTKTPAGQPQKVNISLLTDLKNNNDRVVNVTGGVRDIAVSPNGKEVAFIHRGEVFVTSVDGGTTKRITNTVEQERSVSFSPMADHYFIQVKEEKAGKFTRCRLQEKKNLIFLHLQF